MLLRGKKTYPGFVNKRRYGKKNVNPCNHPYLWITERGAGLEHKWNQKSENSLKKTPQ